jgi:hypothetical protein
MVRERGLHPLLSPTSCGQQLLLDLHGLLVVAICNPFSFPSLAPPCSRCVERVERDELERERESKSGESESVSELVMLIQSSKKWTGVLACGTKRKKTGYLKYPLTLQTLKL